MIKQLKEIYKSVIISVPEGSEVENNQKQETIAEENPEEMKPVETGSKFCGQCGKKLQ